MAHFSEFVYILPANIYFESCRLILSLTYILAVLVDFNAGSDMRGIYFDLNRYLGPSSVYTGLNWHCVV